MAVKTPSLALGVLFASASYLYRSASQIILQSSSRLCSKYKFGLHRLTFRSPQNQSGTDIQARYFSSFSRTRCIRSSLDKLLLTALIFAMRS